MFMLSQYYLTIVLDLEYMRKFVRFQSSLSKRLEHQIYSLTILSVFSRKKVLILYYFICLHRREN